MSWWQGLLLGVLQGFTEFLPVSSSGHLALAQMAFVRMGLAFRQPGVVFDAMLHVGTAVAVICTMPSSGDPRGGCWSRTCVRGTARA